MQPPQSHNTGEAAEETGSRANRRKPWKAPRLLRLEIAETALGSFLTADAQAGFFAG